MRQFVDIWNEDAYGIMESALLKYGKKSISFDYDRERFQVVACKNPGPPLSDRDLGGMFDTPIGSQPLEEIVGHGESVLIAVPDATRAVGAGQLVNLIVRRLIANGTMPYEISVIFSTGLHRSVTAREKARILTPFITQRVKTLDHNPGNLAGLVRLGDIAGGLPVEINRAVVESDHVLLVGGIAFHYFAGFTGGRKLLCPGLSSKRTILGTHALAFDRELGVRANGVEMGKLEGNPVHEAFVEAVERVKPSFAFNTFTNDPGEITALYCGDWQASHKQGCEDYLNQNEVALKQKRDLVIASCGGYPHDINLIQAHKSLETAAMACKNGGTIILVAECRDGAGSVDFENWIGHGGSETIAARLREKYSVGGQTAWSLLSKTEKFDIRIVTSLSDEAVKKAGMRKETGLAEALAASRPFESGYILPHGARILGRVQ